MMITQKSVNRMRIQEERVPPCREGCTRSKIEGIMAPIGTPSEGTTSSESGIEEGRERRIYVKKG